MNFYDIIMTPLEGLYLESIRKKIITASFGDTLEIGFGTGVNFKYYDYHKITNLTCLDVDIPPKIQDTYPNVKFIEGSVEEMPFEPKSFDCVVVSLVLCTVDIKQSLAQIMRVLKPNGVFHFIEHVRPTGKIQGRLADMVNVIWPKIANGCNLNRLTDNFILESGFTEIDIKSKGIFRYGTAKKA